MLIDKALKLAASLPSDVAVNHYVFTVSARRENKKDQEEVKVKWTKQIEHIVVEGHFKMKLLPVLNRDPATLL